MKNVGLKDKQELRLDGKRTNQHTRLPWCPCDGHAKRTSLAVTRFVWFLFSPCLQLIPKTKCDAPTDSGDVCRQKLGLGTQVSNC